MSKPFELRPWQVPMLEHLLEHDRGCLFAGMGLGKTSTTLAAIDAINAVDGEHKTLVLAPKRVALSTWPDEARKWDSLRHIEVSPIIGSPEDRREALRRDANVYTINYENLPWLIETLDGVWPFERVVADESVRLKNFRLGGAGGRRARAIGRVAHKQVKSWWNLTGTPSPNGVADLWGQLWFVDAGQRLCRTYGSFQQRFMSQQMRGDFVEWKPKDGALEQVRGLISDVALSLRIQDFVDIREPIVRKIYVDLPSRARQHYDTMEKQLFAEIQRTPIEAFNSGARTQKCQQIAQGAVYKNQDYDDEAKPLPREFVPVHDEKIDALESIVAESGGMPILVSYAFRSDLARLLKEFPGSRILDEDPATQREWNVGKIPMLLAHPESAGHGLNLQDGSNILVYFGVSWNLEHMQQILERIGPTRQMQSGHDRPVFVYYILARDTIDEDILERTDGKSTVQDSLMKGLRRRHK